MSEPLRTPPKYRNLWIAGFGLAAVLVALVVAVNADMPLARRLGLTAFLSGVPTLMGIASLRSASFLNGTVLRQRRLFRTRSVDLRAATDVRLRNNHIGSLLLQVRSEGGKKVLCPIYNDNAPATLTAAQLERLAEALAQSSAGTAAAQVLRVQAAALAAGVPLTSTPLVRKQVDVLSAGGDREATIALLS